MMADETGNDGPDPDPGGIRWPVVGRGRATLKDVATLAAVSFKTVSRVLNNEGGFSAETARRVREAAAALSYQRDEGARQLRRRRSGIIAMVVPSLLDPTFAEMCEGAEVAVRRAQMAMFMANTRNRPAEEEDIVRAIGGRRPDGMVLVPTAASQQYLINQGQSEIPVVALDRPLGGLITDTVLADNAGGVRDAVEHLVRFGHQRIAFLGDSKEVFTARERVAGFRATAEVHGIEADPALIDLARPSQERIAQVVRALLELAEPPTALIAGNNVITHAVLNALVGVPFRPAVVGFDNFALSDLLQVTVVAQDPQLMAQIAVEMLLARIEDPTLATRTVRVSTRIIARGSGEVRPSGT